MIIVMSSKENQRMSRHAYLIMCHKCDDTLKYSLKSIDDERNDVYIHVDKKTKNFDFELVKSYLKKSRLFFTKRIKVVWGGGIPN